jgi:hypothetical protein
MKPILLSLALATMLAAAQKDEIAPPGDLPAFRKQIDRLVFPEVIEFMHQRAPAGLEVEGATLVFERFAPKHPITFSARDVTYLTMSALIAEQADLDAYLTTGKLVFVQRGKSPKGTFQKLSPKSEFVPK